MRAEIPDNFEPPVERLPRQSGPLDGSGADSAAEATMLGAWIDDRTAECPEHIEAAMAHDPALRGLIRDLRLGLFEGETASAALRDRLISLPLGRSVLGRIGGWSVAAAAAIALAFLGLQLGASTAPEPRWSPASDLAAVGLTTQVDDDVLIAMLLPDEENPS